MHEKLVKIDNYNDYICYHNHFKIINIIMTEHAFLFYIYDIDQVGPTNVHNDAILVKTCKIDTEAPDYYEQLSDRYNEELPKFLTKQNINHFIPLKNPSIETKNDVVSICYYHNLKAYNIIYKLFPEYICFPKPQVEQELNNLYHAHGLDGWYDPRSNPLVEYFEEEQN